MILPIVAYGNKSLRQKSIEIDKNYPNLSQIIDDMFETMINTKGVGLSAPQINLNIRLFIIQGIYPISEKTFKGIFINPEIIEENGEEWSFNEGCLSVPGINEEVKRKPNVRIQYYDQNWQFHDEWFDSIQARVIQHEYDHLEGIIFTDLINPLRKAMISKTLNNIIKGKISTEYKMIFYKKVKKN